MRHQGFPFQVPRVSTRALVTGVLWPLEKDNTAGREGKPATAVFDTDPLVAVVLLACPSPLNATIRYPSLQSIYRTSWHLMSDSNFTNMSNQQSSIGPTYVSSLPFRLIASRIPPCTYASEHHMSKLQLSSYYCRAWSHGLWPSSWPNRPSHIHCGSHGFRRARTFPSHASAIHSSSFCVVTFHPTLTSTLQQRLSNRWGWGFHHRHDS